MTDLADPFRNGFAAFRAALLARLLQLMTRAVPAAFAKAVLDRAERRAALAWLKPLERAVRLLVLTIAARLPEAAYEPTPPQSVGVELPHGPRTRPTLRLLTRRLFPGRTGARGRRSAGPAPLAGRLDATLSVLRNPMRCALRLARRVARYLRAQLSATSAAAPRRFAFPACAARYRNLLGLRPLAPDTG